MNFLNHNPEDQIKIAVIHSRFIEGGGAEAPALWTVEALMEDYDVHLVTMGKLNVDRLNECYGTDLRSDRIKMTQIPIPYLFRKRFDALRSYRLARFCKRNSSAFDLMISAYNVMNFNQKGIQYISDFSFNDKLRRAFDKSPIRLKGFKGIFYLKSPLRWIYLQIGKILSGTFNNNWKRNVTITNSNWSGKVMSDYFGVETKTIYPPVFVKYADIPWEKKEDGFVCIGRLVPQKRIDGIINIIRKLREREMNVHLHIVGRVDDINYKKYIERLCAENSDWVFMEGEKFGEEKEELIALHKFGISGCRNEAFGIAVAEMVKAGCLVWVPDGGGQVEVVNHPALIYDDLEDGVNKIELVFKDKEKQSELRKRLAKQSESFSSESFMFEIKEVVRHFLSKNV